MDFFINIVGIPLGYIMKLIYHLVNNYGVAIIIFTLITKLIMFPISYKQQKNSARVQLINPKLAKLREKYKDNPEKLQTEQMRLYQEENINPMGSCLPMVISLILLWGVLAVVYKPMTYIMDYSSETIAASKEIVLQLDPDSSVKKESMREELFIMEAIMQNKEAFTEAAKEYEAVDQTFIDTVSDFAETFTIGSTNLSEKPSFKYAENSTMFLFLLPFLSGIVQLIMTIYMQVMQKKRNPDMPSMGCMNVMLYGMPLFSIWLAFTVPAGVGFYWLCSSLFSFIQSIGLYAWFNDKRVEKIGEKEREKAKKNKRRPSMMQMMLEQQEELNRQQSGSRSGPANRVRYSDGDDAPKLSKRELDEYNNAVIREARRRMAEKYGENENQE